MERIPKEERVKVIIALCVVVGIMGTIVCASLFLDAEVVILHRGEEKRIENLIGIGEGGHSVSWAGHVEATVLGEDMNTTFIAERVGISVIKGIHCPNGVFIPELIDYENDIKKYVFIVIP